ncbi:MAG: hypothetical protein IV100_07775 [Myxococcales bacterium]|nr:hypothetical protein [Myxococcales bacterium]
MLKVSRPLNQSPVKPQPAVSVAPTKPMRPQGYESGQAALRPKAPARTAADDLRHQQACTSANVSVGRNEYLAERGAWVRSVRANRRAPELAQRRDIACDPNVSADTAALMASLAQQAVAPDEQGYEAGETAKRQEAHDNIKTAKNVGTVMDVAGSAAELFLPGAWGATRAVLGRCAEEIASGDGSCSLEDMAQAGLMNYAGDTGKKAIGQTFAHFRPGAAGKIEAAVAKRGLKFGGGRP